MRGPDAITTQGPLTSGLKQGPSIWVAVPLVIITTFATFSTIPNAGLDASWLLGLSWARDLGLVWGWDIAYTYGPWGLLNGLVPLTQLNLALALIIWLAFLGLVAYGVWRLVAPQGRWIALTFAFLVASQSTVGGFATTGLIAVILISLGLVFDRVANTYFLLVLGIVAGVSVMIKFNYGVTAILVVILAAFACRSIGRALALTFTGIAIGFFGGWLLAGQPFAAIGSYLSQSIQLALGYRQGLGNSPADQPLVSQAWPILGVFILVFAIGLSVLATRGRGARVRIITLLILTGSTISFYLASAIRLDAGHAPFLIVFIVTVLVPVMAGLSVQRRRWLSVGGAALVFVGGMAAATVVSGSNWVTQTIHPLGSIQQLASTTHTAITDSERVDQLQAQREFLRVQYPIAPWELAAQLPPTTVFAPPSAPVVAALADRRVHAEPWAVSAVWASDLTWNPVPVFQTHQAYTTKLDTLNRDYLVSTAGPDGILRQSASLDLKNPLWEAPQYQLALMCNFTEAAHDDFWQALIRSNDRCGSPTALSSVELAAGERVNVPDASDALIVAHVIASDTGGESLTQYPTIFCDDRTYRLSQGFPSGPLIVSAESSEWSDEFLPNACQTIGASVNASIEFVAIPVR